MAEGDLINSGDTITEKEKSQHLRHDSQMPFMRPSGNLDCLSVNMYLSEGLRQPVLKKFLMDREAGSFVSRE